MTTEIAAPVRGSNRAGASIALATSAAAMAVLPPFLLTLLFPVFQDDVSIDRNQVAALLPLFFFTSAFTAPMAGALVSRHGARAVLAFAGACTSLALLLIPTAAWQALVLVPIAIVGGVGNGLAQPTTNHIIVSNITRRRGLGIGLKQAAFPAATFTAGLAVPVAADALAWQWTVVALGMFVLGLTVVGSRMVTPAATPRAIAQEQTMTRSRVVAATASACLSVVAAASLAALFVDFAVETGRAASTAGVALAIASVGSGATRLVLGHLADRRCPSFLAVGVLMLAAAPGYLSLSLSDSTAPLFIGALLGLVLGWGWDGALLYGVIVRSARSAAASTGTLIAGLALGSAVGPPLTSLIAGEDGRGYDRAWTLNGIFTAVAGVIMLWLHLTSPPLPPPVTGPPAT